MMKKLIGLSLLLALSTGCGRGWFPHLRGAPCRGLCSTAAPAQMAAPECDNCVENGGNAMSGEVMQGGYEQFGDVGTQVMGEAIVAPGTMPQSYTTPTYPTPPMSSLPRTAN